MSIQSLMATSLRRAGWRVFAPDQSPYDAEVEATKLLRDAGYTVIYPGPWIFGATGIQKAIEGLKREGYEVEKRPSATQRTEQAKVQLASDGYDVLLRSKWRLNEAQKIRAVTALTALGYRIIKPMKFPEPGTSWQPTSAIGAARSVIKASCLDVHYTESNEPVRIITLAAWKSWARRVQAIKL